MKILTRRTTTVVAAGMLTALVATAASAQVASTSEVTQSVAAGSLTASTSDLVLDEVTYSHADQTTAGGLTLNADDTTGSGDGWNVTVQASDFVLFEGDGTHDIDAANFALTGAGAPVSTAGQDAEGVSAVTTEGSLDAARTVMSAAVDAGSGTYTQDLGVALTVPGQARAGSYTGTVTTTIASGPSA